MATMDEIALGIASVLRATKLPEPLPVDLWGDSLHEGSIFVRAVISECSDASIPLRFVTVPLDLWTELTFNADARSEIEGVRIEPLAQLKGRVEFWRDERR